MDEQMQQQIVQLVQAAMQGDQQAQQQVQQIMQAAQQGDQQAQQIAQMIQAVVQQMQGQQAQMARFGAKLNYIKYLRGKCPEGYEMQYMKTGGKTVKAGCKKCQKAAEGEKMDDPVTVYKCGRKMKKKAQGGNVDTAKCGKKMKKAEEGTKIIKNRNPAMPLEPYNKYLQRGGGQWNNTSGLSRWSGEPVTDVYFDNGDYIGYDQPAYGNPGLAEGVYANGNDMDEIQATWRLRDAFRPAAIDTSIEGAPSSRKKTSKKANGGTIDIFAPYRNLKLKS